MLEAQLQAPGEPAAPTRGSPWMSTEEAATRLGVKRATVYTYVSRGLIRRERRQGSSDLRRSDVEGLALRGRHPRSARSLSMVIESSITEIRADGHYYRGQAALSLAQTTTVEQAAELLWEARSARIPWQAPLELCRAAAVYRSADRDDAPPLDRLRSVVSAAAGRSRPARDRGALVEQGRSLLATMVESIPLRTPAVARRASGRTTASLAERLWPRLSRRRPRPGDIAALNAALVLCADHELSASTLAARIAASMGAGLHSCLLSAIGAFNAPGHGSGVLQVERLLHAVEGTSSAGATLAAQARSGQLPGFGHPLYPGGDPRCRALLGMVRRPSLAVSRVLDEATSLGQPPPQVDFALAALTVSAGMPEGSASAIFAISRSVGWIAHVLEEYEAPHRYRPRAVYVGSTIGPPLGDN